jgi:hypothetical protein
VTRTLRRSELVQGLGAPVVGTAGELVAQVGLERSGIEVQRLDQQRAVG